MEQKKAKVQIHLPHDLVLKIEQDMNRHFLKKSSWFEKLARHYFEEMEKKGGDNGRKLIKLNF
ncbi:MAG: hypothetical protein WCG04_04745 [Alphaproteobacteria bacterium]